MASTNRSTGLATLSFSRVASTTPENAPMPMKPACPRLSSPHTPTSRFSDTASTT